MVKDNKQNKPNTKDMATIKDVLKEKNKATRDQIYNDYVKDITPKHNGFENLCKAYIIGGVICCIGQYFMNLYASFGANKDMAGSYTTITLIFLSVLLTGFGLYPKLCKFGGAGTIVPITGFANSVAAPAIEYKQEGQVFGIGCKIFTIAGPVILYGIFSSWLLGVIYYALFKMNIIS